MKLYLERKDFADVVDQRLNKARKQVGRNQETHSDAELDRYDARLEKARKKKVQS